VLGSCWCCWGDRSNDIVQFATRRPSRRSPSTAFHLIPGQAEKAVNWGIAAVVWYALGRVIARLLLRC
jgi:hypothetical protein